ncbi:MAG: class I SAM-dependent methyltransferase [Phycisphaerales bacterium]|nr:MAG: class I SAM-dependent methyltransferase [Phycisphaerales bacterium]
MNNALKLTIGQCRKFIDGRDDALALPPESASFAHALVLSRGAKRCLEIGTSYGYSGLWIGGAAQVNGGKLVTIDKDQRKSDIAGAYFADAGLGNVVECMTGRATDIVRALEGPFDFVLNDADKENLTTYVEMLRGKLAPHAVILTDNITSHAAEAAPFVEHMRNHPAFFSTLVPVGSGMELSVYLGG